MRRKFATMASMLIYLFVVTILAYGQELSNYLILSNIGDFRASKNPSSGKGPGIVVGADHFYIDHDDMTYRISYFNKQTRVGPKAQVTQHAGSDSDKWLLHEVDSGFRDKYGTPAVSYYPWQIDSQTVLINAVGGREYRWLSGYKVVEIEYHGSLTQTPEPLEVVKAYLAKHPSTLSAMTLSQLRSTDSKIKWIKDEMDRRLWLCDKWYGQLSAGKTDQKTALDAVVKSMNVFLDYREKYYGIKAADEKNLIEGYLYSDNSTGITTKLTEYKTWWAAHKGDSISL